MNRGRTVFAQLLQFIPFVSYADAENEARVARRGLWQEAEPTPPWDWRRQQKTRKK